MSSEVLEYDPDFQPKFALKDTRNEYFKPIIWNYQKGSYFRIFLLYNLSISNMIFHEEKMKSCAVRDPNKKA